MPSGSQKNPSCLVGAQSGALGTQATLAYVWLLEKVRSKATVCGVCTEGLPRTVDTHESTVTVTGITLLIRDLGPAVGSRHDMICFTLQEQDLITLLQGGGVGDTFPDWGGCLLHKQWVLWLPDSSRSFLFNHH